MTAWVTAKANAFKNATATLSNISQAISDVMSPARGKHGGHLKDGAQVLHASAGNKQQGSSCSIFFVRLGNGIVRIVAAGEHHGSGTYLLYWSDPDFTSKKTVTL